MDFLLAVSVVLHLRSPATENEYRQCVQLHLFLTETNQYDGKTVRLKRTDGTEIPHIRFRPAGVTNRPQACYHRPNQARGPAWQMTARLAVG